ncbi:hypothetical protein NDU88_003473 [Pleurodeles waltl]|uniref:Endonuclease/exonuclease/phosphatase domain-containing protein n=1 Tax=Pleurodeles waltl TaxID=8319 RepID=A0AAV7UG98_PLEWA|nr:hypothetical protein NDU88_003473 [Pleurodeles waltl]
MLGGVSGSAACVRAPSPIGPVDGQRPGRSWSPGASVRGEAVGEAIRPCRTKTEIELLPQHLGQVDLYNTIGGAKRIIIINVYIRPGNMYDYDIQRGLLEEDLELLSIGMFYLNRRMKKDCPAKQTFRIDNQICPIDYAFVNAWSFGEVQDFEVEHIEGSDHWPLRLTKQSTDKKSERKGIDSVS